MHPAIWQERDSQLSQLQHTTKDSSRNPPPIHKDLSISAPWLQSKPLLKALTPLSIHSILSYSTHSIAIDSFLESAYASGPNYRVEMTS